MASYDCREGLGRALAPPGLVRTLWDCGHNYRSRYRAWGKWGIPGLVVPTAALSKLEIVSNGFLILGRLALQGMSPAP